MRTLLVGTILLSLCCAVAAEAQQIRIVVVEAHHGRPVADECLNISLGPWHGADLLGATDKDGMVVLSLDQTQATVAVVPGKTCNGMSSIKPLPVSNLPTAISVLPDWYVSCQYSKKLVKDPVWLQKSSSERIESFLVQDILTKGITATNSCSHLTFTSKPGELVLVVRKRTFLEGMRS